MVRNSGFTLIEMLVVVLIIGILSSVALPQYKKAVQKARATEAIQAGKSWGVAQRVYELEYGHYTSDLNELSVKIPDLKHFYMSVGSSDRVTFYPNFGSNEYYLEFSMGYEGAIYGSCVGGDICRGILPCNYGSSCEM
jgi:prepilin-type N-terminal cleavage/methylation domain-containing protein